MHNQVLLVIPCYNERFRFPVEYWRELITENPKIDWLFVDDGSTDDTLNLLNQLSNAENVSVARSNFNLGKGNAVRFGFYLALEKTLNLEFLGFLDADGAFSKEDVFAVTSSLLVKMNGVTGRSFDVLISSRVALAGRSIYRKSTRHFIGRIIATLLTSHWKSSPYDTQSGFKIFRNTSAFREAINPEFETKWFFDIEILTRIGTQRNGELLVWEEPVNYWRDV